MTREEKRFILGYAAFAWTIVWLVMLTRCAHGQGITFEQGEDIIFRLSSLQNITNSGFNDVGGTGNYLEDIMVTLGAFAAPSTHTSTLMGRIQAMKEALINIETYTGDMGTTIEDLHDLHEEIKLCFGEWSLGGTVDVAWLQQARTSLQHLSGELDADITGLNDIKEQLSVDGPLHTMLLDQLDALHSTAVGIAISNQQQVNILNAMVDSLNELRTIRLTLEPMAADVASIDTAITGPGGMMFDLEDIREYSEQVWTAITVAGGMRDDLDDLRGSGLTLVDLSGDILQALQAMSAGSDLSAVESQLALIAADVDQARIYLGSIEALVGTTNEYVHDGLIDGVGAPFLSGIRNEIFNVRRGLFHDGGTDTPYLFTMDQNLVTLLTHVDQVEPLLTQIRDELQGGTPGPPAEPVDGTFDSGQVQGAIYGETGPTITSHMTATHNETRPLDWAFPSFAEDGGAPVWEWHLPLPTWFAGTGMTNLTEWNLEVDWSFFDGPMRTICHLLMIFGVSLTAAMMLWEEVRKYG